VKLVQTTVFILCSYDRAHALSGGTGILLFV